MLCLFCFQLSLDVTHLQATAAGHCGGHGAHVDAERTANGSLWVISPPSVSSRNAGICRVFLGFSFHRSFLFFVISNERYLYATHGLEKEIKNPQNINHTESSLNKSLRLEGTIRSLQPQNLDNTGHLENSTIVVCLTFIMPASTSLPLPFTQEDDYFLWFQINQALSFTCQNWRN